MIDNTLGQPRLALIFFALGLICGVVFFFENALLKKSKKAHAYIWIWDGVFSCLTALAYITLFNKLCYLKFMLLQPISFAFGIVVAVFSITCIKSLFQTFLNKKIKKNPKNTKKTA